MTSKHRNRVSLLMVSRLGDHIEAGVFLESFRDADAFGSLVVFEKCCDDARQCEGATVEGMHQLDVAVFVLEA